MTSHAEVVDFKMSGTTVDGAVPLMFSPSKHFQKEGDAAPGAAVCTEPLK